MTLSSKVEAIVLVARIDRLRRPILREMQRVLQGSPAKPLGIVITAAEQDEGYGYAYYKRRYYHYLGKGEQIEPSEAIKQR